MPVAQDPALCSVFHFVGRGLMRVAVDEIGCVGGRERFLRYGVVHICVAGHFFLFFTLQSDVARDGPAFR